MTCAPHHTLYTNTLHTTNHQQALRVLLVLGRVASEEAGLELLAYELLQRAFELYEDSVPDSRGKVRAFGSWFHCSCV